LHFSFFILHFEFALAPRAKMLPVKPLRQQVLGYLIIALIILALIIARHARHIPWGAR
jgi:hypothetical protein